MKIRRTFLVLVFVLVLLSSVLSYVFSQEDGLQESEEGIVIYDPDNPDSYWDPEFYQYTSPTFWRWEYVNWQIDSIYEYIDWELVDYNEPVMYQYPEFFDNLPDGKYSEIRYDLIEDYSLIDSVKIDGTKYANDFGCSGCSFDAGTERMSLIYSTDGFIFHSTSSDNIYIGDYPEGTRFIANPEGITVVCSETSDELCYSERGSFSINTEDRGLNYQGNSIKGLISFWEGQTYLKEEGEVTINAIAIVDEGTPGGVNIYFDGEEHQGDYISIGGERIIIESNSGKTAYGFLTGNDFFDVPIGDNGDVAENTLLFIPGIGSKIEVEDRSEVELIPRVTIYRNKPVEMRNGANIFTFSREGDYYESFEEGGESIPFTLIYLDQNGERISVRGGDNERAVFDMNNNFIIVSGSDIPESQLECYDCTLDLTENDFLYDYYTAQILGNSNIKIDDHIGNPITLSLIASYLRDLPPDLRESINVVQILTDEEINRVCGENSDACANSDTNTIRVRESITFHTFEHESAHTLTFELEDRVDAREGELLAYEFFLVKKYGAEDRDDFFQNYRSAITIEENSRLSELENAFNEEYDNSFKSMWLENAGGDNFYSDIRGALGEPTVAERLSTYWSGEDPDFSEATEPRYGCFSPYACNNFREDVAETVERFADMQYDFIRDIINPDSKWYQYRMNREIGNTGEVMTRETAEDWAMRARGRVQNVCENPFEEYFVSEEECSMVLGD